MNAIDIASGLVLLISALVGFWRGALREVVALAALALGALAAVYLLPISASLARHAVHPRWAAKAAAVLGVFAVVYLAVRIAGGALSKALREQAGLGTLDRTSGAGLGLVRGLGVLGAAWLAVHAVMPQMLDQPAVGRSLLYPLSRGAGRTLAAAAPGGMQAAGGFGQALAAGLTDTPGSGDTVDGGSQDSRADGNSASPPPTPADEGDAPYRRLSGRRAHRRASLAVVTGDPVQE